MNQKLSTRSLIGLLTVLAVLPSQVLSQDNSQGIEGFFKFLIFVSDDPVTSNEYRRRVDFRNRTTSKIHTGGVTVKLREPNMPAKIYFYDYKKFGSRGKYMEFSINSLNDIQPGNVTNRARVVKSSEFWFAGWATVSLKKLSFLIESKAGVAGGEANNNQTGGSRRRILESKITAFLSNLKVKSVDPKYPDFDIEVVKVHGKSLSWVFRLFFYLLNFCLVYFVYLRDIPLYFIDPIPKYQKNDFERFKQIPQRAAFVYFLVSLIAFRLVFTYYFIIAIYFWLPSIILSLFRIKRIWGYLRQKKVLFSFLTLAVPLFLISFFWVDITPFFILFFNLSLTFDLVTDERVGVEPARVTFLNILMANIYIAFICYNPGNHVYYYPSIPLAIIWAVSTILVSLLNIIIIASLKDFLSKFGCFMKCLYEYEDPEILKTYQEDEDPVQSQNNWNRGYDPGENKLNVSHNNRFNHYHPRKEQIYSFELQSYPSTSSGFRNHDNHFDTFRTQQYSFNRYQNPHLTNILPYIGNRPFRPHFDDLTINRSRT